MTARLIPVLLIAISLVYAGCQNYTSGLQQSVARADETGAIAALRSIAVAQQAYTVSNSGEYGTLKQLVDGGFLDARMTSDKAVRGYQLTLKVTPKSGDNSAGAYTCNVDPDATVSGGKHYYIDSSSNVIHVNETQPASAADKSIE